LRDALIIASHSMRRTLRLRSVGPRILCFHEITEDKAAQFEERIEWLAERVELCSLDDVALPSPGSRPRVAITFDDGYSCWHDVAAPVLAARSVPATFFVCSGYVGLEGAAAEGFLATRIKRKENLLPLSGAQLRGLASDPLFRIGCHTASHLNLGHSYAAAVLEREIADSKDSLEQETGRPVDTFAFPFGGPRNMTPENIRYVRGCGFRSAYSIIPGFVPASPRFVLGRDCLNLETSTRVWAAWLSGAYDGFFRIKESLVSRLGLEKAIYNQDLGNRYS
jgi:peptidoglycan/xylan/chitin deacetylase (PgdA/CDA1 family)